MPQASLSKDEARIGFIGLGLMGSRLARRLYASGWKLQVWNRSPEPMRAANRDGISSVASVADLATESTVLLSCLANDAAVRSVYFDDGGVLTSAKPGTILLEMSTISAELSLEIHQRAAQRGLRLLDVAISGSTPAVEAGTITLLAGGDRDTFDQCAPLFSSIAQQWFLIGPAASGVRMKLVVNLLLGVGMLAVAEAVALGEHLGIDDDVLFDVLSKTAVVPPALRGKFRKIKSGDYSPEFPLRLVSKDMNLVIDAAGSSGPELPAARAAQQVFSSQAASSGDLDLSAIASFVAGSRKPPTPHKV